MTSRESQRRPDYIRRASSFLYGALVGAIGMAAFTFWFFIQPYKAKPEPKAEQVNYATAESFSPSTVYSFEPSCWPENRIYLPDNHTVSGDFDGDGALDVLFFRQNVADGGEICVLRNTTPQKVESLGGLEEKIR